MAGLVGMLVLLLAFLYVKTQAHDPSRYFENVEKLRQLNHLDARWELNVLKSRMGINQNYDTLVEPLADLNKLPEELQMPEARGEAFRQTVRNKTSLVEQFKSHNSVLRNSLAFLPTAADDARQAMRAAGLSQTLRDQLSADLNAVLLDALIYSQAPSNDKAAEIRSRLDRLLGNANHEMQSLNIFAAHLRTVLREQPVVNELLQSVVSVPLSAKIDEIDNWLASDERDAALEVQRYRKLLLIFAAALIAFLVYAAVSLIHSHALVLRVNGKLQEANANLERRVQERTRELHAAQSELMSTARRAGMAEIANNVLHNVGNVLNSVNVSATLISGAIRNSKAHMLTQAVDLMNEHTKDLGNFFTRDEKGKMLPGYLNKLVKTLAAERRGVIEELTALANSIDHIKEIVATQQSHAGCASVVEPVQVKDILQEAIRLTAGAMARHQVAIVTDFEEAPTMLLDKARLLQILVNLIQNAKQAMEGAPERAREVVLRIDTTDLAGDRQLRVRVEDNGHGIAPENLARLFVHGFSTRKHGHGFGLHSCALAAKDMGGTLMAHSDGPGKGAAFTLALPIRPAVDPHSTLSVAGRALLAVET